MGVAGKVILVRDLITPDLEKKIAAARQSATVLRAGAEELVSIAQGAIKDPALRAATWPAKKDGTPATLIKTTSLVRSLRVIEAAQTHATVGSDRPYAAAHQFGYPPRNLPARPYFPFIGGRLAAWARERIGRVMREKWESISGRRPGA